MIDELHIQGLGVIEDATLRLGDGLTVVTGETGAGKTMVVTALEMLLGARADAALVREGSPAAVIEARLSPVPPGMAGDEAIVQREIAVGDDGRTRSRARLEGRLATVGELAETLGRWVEVHGQGEHIRLARPDVQRRLLDRFAGADHRQAIVSYRETYQRWREAAARLAELEGGARQRAREIARLRHEVDEISAAGIDVDTDADLDAELSRLEHAATLIAAAMAAAETLDEDGAGGPIGVAVSTLRREADHDPRLAELLGRAESMAAELSDLRRELRDYATSVDGDPSRLEQLRDRRRVLAELQRRYGPSLADVLSYAAQAARQLDGLDVDEDSESGLRLQLEALDRQVAEQAAALRRGRLHASERLVGVVEDHLRDLAMPHARFEIAIDATDAPGSDGADRIVFLLSANPGQPPRPVGEAASGGERSRVALAIEVALAEVDDAQVLVFDEVDAGVGGAAAMAVGEKLAQVAWAREGRQVLCVTHLAQIAAFADTHHVVEKGVVDGRTVTGVRAVEADARAGELARMTSGTSESEIALDHARELLEEASRRRGVPRAASVAS